ncbi:hypothetical protein BG015_011795 [Linnemannia schmuckeri]|uniref:Caleosin n=1 Tax=Linnemannia schmuckeri TaxID=64567 RepID=A0A9P5VED4_9FUNG|nr:hypothetical protein BG015_011795 [Linnemannia schmuckeri]
MTSSQFQVCLQEQPTSVERKPFLQSSSSNGHGLTDLGTGRVNTAATPAHPNGTVKNNWAKEHSHETVLQQHCSFFDSDGDGIIWPIDTFRGFYALRFNIFLSLLAVFIIHFNFSYPTAPSLIPDPFFRIWIHRIHKDKHGSDSGTYDTEGRFVPQHFEDIFSKYAPPGQDGLTYSDVWRMLKGQRVIMDPIGWFGAFFEWTATYLMLWPDDGIMRKEDIRRVYDGSIFHEWAAKSSKTKAQKT